MCAGLLDKKYAYTCQEQTNKLLLQKLGIDVDEDQPDVQPKRFCQSCCTKATQYSETVKSSLVVLEWQSHSDPWSSCCFFKSKDKGGRPKKEKKNRGRPWSNLLRTGSCIRHYLHIECHLLCLFLNSCHRQQFHSEVQFV